MPPATTWTARPPDDTPPAPTVSLTVSGKLNSAGNSGSAPVTDGAVAFEAALADLLGNAAITRRLAAADLPARLMTAVVGDVTPEALYGNGGSYRDGRDLRLEPGGTGRYTDSVHDGLMRWAINADGVVEVRFDNAPSSSVSSTTFTPEGTPVITVCTRRLEEVDVQSIGPDAAIVRDRQVQTCSPAAPKLEFDTRSSRTMLAIDPLRLPAFAAADVSGMTLALGLPLEAEPPTGGWCCPTARTSRSSRRRRSTTS